MKRKPEKKPEVVRHEILSMDDVLDEADNENVHDEAQHVLLRASVRIYGQQESILVAPIPNSSKVKVIGGHGIKAAMLDEGFTHIRCEYSSLQGAKRAAYRIVTNQLGRLSYFDLKLLPLNVDAIMKLAKKEKLTVDAEWFGFQPDELEHLRSGDNWQSKTLNVGAIGDYDPAHETFVIKITGIIQKDKARIFKKVRTALHDTNYEPTCY